jgi:hypothetical protein
VKPLRLHHHAASAFAAHLARALFALLLALVLAPAWAHKPSDSYLTLKTEGEQVSARWDIALRDLDYVLQLDRDGNGELSWGEVRTRADDIAAYATARLGVAVQGRACPWKTAAPLQLDRHSDGTYAVLSLAAACEAMQGGLELKYSLLFDVDPTHRGLVQWQAPGAAQPQALVFGTDSAQQTLKLDAPSALETLRQYIWEGIWHIWIGFDHILFLVALLLPAVLMRTVEGWKAAPSLKAASIEVLKVVTAFTVAHSITLSLAALGVVSLPSRLVESVIAASVVLAALNNLRATVDKRRWVMAFVFGLVHGFGFASVLADLGLPQDALVLALVGFNVGVELGQLAIVVVMFPVLFLLRRLAIYRRVALPLTAVAMILISMVWVVERSFDVKLPRPASVASAVRSSLS